jgi:hypothetical protein
MSLAETTPLSDRFDRWIAWIMSRGGRRPKHAAPPSVRVGQKWKVYSQGEWLGVTVLRFEEGLVVLRFDQPDRAGSREGVTLAHFMLTTPDCYRCEAA